MAHHRRKTGEITCSTANRVSALKKLDAEHCSRMREISTAWHSGQNVEVSDIFHSVPVVPLLPMPKVILPGFRPSEIYANYPFTQRLFVILCPRCLTSAEFPTVREILTHSDIVPILASSRLLDGLDWGV
jgi:hypothetical protein